jgi:hypothetical protein
LKKSFGSEMDDAMYLKNTLEMPFWKVFPSEKRNDEYKCFTRCHYKCQSQMIKNLKWSELSLGNFVILFLNDLYS